MLCCQQGSRLGVGREAHSPGGTAGKQVSQRLLGPHRLSLRCLFLIKEGSDVLTQVTHLGETKTLMCGDEAPREPRFRRPCLAGSGEHLLGFCVLGVCPSLAPSFCSLH